MMDRIDKNIKRIDENIEKLLKELKGYDNTK